MHNVREVRTLGFAVVAALLLAACSTAAPAANPAPTAKPAATTAPAAAPTTAPAAKPAGAAPAASSPVATKPAASTPAPAAAAKPTAAPAAFNEKEIASFYQGKTIHILVGSAAGGGYDLYSRMIARHMGKYIPGNPTVVVDNMPGAGGVLALKTLYSTAPKDGTTMGNFQGGLASQQLYGATAADYDVTKLQYLGAPATNTWVMVVDAKAMAAKGITRLQDVLGPNGKSIVIGGNAPGSGQYDAAVLLRDLAHANAKVVGGYGGTSQIKIAMEQGEVDAFFVGWESVKTTNRDDIEKGDWKLLVQMKEKPHPELKDVPLISSVLDEQTMKLMRYGLIMPDQFLRPYGVAAEVPADRVAALRQAFEKALKDPELLAEAEKSKLDLAPIPADELRESIIQYMAMPADVKETLKKSLVAGL